MLLKNFTISLLSLFLVSSFLPVEAGIKSKIVKSAVVIGTVKVATPIVKNTIIKKQKKR